VHNVTIHKGIFKQGRHSIDVILGHLSAKHGSANKGLKSFPLFAQQAVVMVDTTGKEVNSSSPQKER
jgi:hypothetical protein